MIFQVHLNRILLFLFLCKFERFWLLIIFKFLQLIWYLWQNTLLRVYFDIIFITFVTFISMIITNSFLADALTRIRIGLVWNVNLILRIFIWLISIFVLIYFIYIVEFWLLIFLHVVWIMSVLGTWNTFRSYFKAFWDRYCTFYRELIFKGMFLTL